MKNYSRQPLSAYLARKLVETLPEDRVLFFDEVVLCPPCGKKKESIFYACLYSKDLRKIIWSAKDSSKDELCDVVCDQIEMLYGRGDLPIYS